MGDEIKYLNTKNEKFPFVYSLNVMNQIQNKYGTLSAWSDLIEPKDGGEPSIEAVLFFFKEAINEGIDIENENRQEPRPFINEKKVGRIITEIGMPEATRRLKGIVVDSTKNDNEENNSAEENNGEEVKNQIATQNLI